MTRVNFLTRETLSVSYTPHENQFITFIQYIRDDGTVRFERPVREMDRLGFPNEWRTFLNEEGSMGITIAPERNVKWGEYS